MSAPDRFLLSRLRRQRVESFQVKRELVQAFISSMGFDPTEVAAVVIDRYEVTVSFKRRDKTAQHLYYDGPCL